MRTVVTAYCFANQYMVLYNLVIIVKGFTIDLNTKELKWSPTILKLFHRSKIIDSRNSRICIYF